MTVPRHCSGSAGSLLADAGPYDGHCSGYSEAELVGPATGSRQMQLVVAQLESGGHVERHTQSHEEAFYVLEGELRLGDVTLPRGSFGLIDVDQPHAWRNDGPEPARWLVMNAPPPLATDPRFGDVAVAHDGSEVGFSRPPALVSTVEAPVPGYARQDMAGVAIDWLVDEHAGADLLRLFLVRYGPGGSMGRHEHPVEESYFVLEGEVRATADDVEVTLTPGDYLWTGAGCVHSFENRTDRDVLWIETQAPQPPRKHPVRFVPEATS